MRTPGFAGADLANLLNESAILAGRRGLKVGVDGGCGWSAVLRGRGRKPPRGFGGSLQQRLTLCALLRPAIMVGVAG